MRKYYVFAAIAALTLLMAGCGKSDKHQREIDVLDHTFHGSIKTITESNYDIGMPGEDDEVMHLQNKCVCSLDEDGRLLTQATYDDRGNLMNMRELTYDERGNLLSETWTDCDGDEFAKSLFAYDDRGNKLSRAEYEDGKLTYREAYTFDAQDNLLLSQRFNDEDSLLLEEKFTYDTRGNLLTKPWIHYDYNPMSRDMGYVNKGYFEYSYDEQGNMLSVRLYSPDGQLMDESRYTYDERNNLLTEENSDNEADAARIVRTYDESNHKLTEALYDDDGEEMQQSIYTYDKRGNKVQEDVMQNGVLIGRTLYTYNTRGNELTEESYLLIDGKMTLSCTYSSTYDKQGHLLVRECVSDDWGLTEEYTYDKKGNIRSFYTHVLGCIAYYEEYEIEYR